MPQSKHALKVGRAEWLVLTGCRREERKAMSAITERIQAYRRGDITFERLVEELSTRNYPAPARFDDPLHGRLEADANRDGIDYPEDGTFDEVSVAWARQELTNEEFAAISDAAYTHHTKRRGAV